MIYLLINKLRGRDMTINEMPKNCPNCRNHCPVSFLRCARGRQWKMVMMSKMDENKQSNNKSIEKQEKN